jgi:glycosyltransferase involved in cell wall biosynthesis
MKNPLVTIVLPAYNEEAIVNESLQKISGYLKTLQSYDFEILLIDDGSKDKTFEIASKCKESIPNLRVLRHPVNMNLGTSIKTGFANARGQYIVTYDMDMSYSLDHIGTLLDTIVTTLSDIVVASPYMKGGKVTNVPFMRKYMSQFVNFYMCISAQHKLHTFTGMVRAYKADFVKSLNLKAMDYEINPEIIYKAMVLRARIVEIPAHLDWTFQNSIGKQRTSGIRVFRGVFSGLMAGFIFRPYIFFLTFGFLLLLVSLYINGWIAINIYNIYPSITVHSGYFDDRFSQAVAEVFNNRPHSFLLGGFFLIISLQFLSMGFISLQNKRYFEENFHINTSIFRKLLKADEKRNK